MLWLFFASLILLTVGIVLYPLLKHRTSNDPQRVDFDLVVYRKQLAELEQEVESGLLTKDQADEGRVEIYRRILSAEDAERKKTTLSARLHGRRATTAVIALITAIVPIGSVIVYGLLGSPQLRGEPYAWRLRHDAVLIAATTAEKLSQQLKNGPSTAADYRRLGNNYFKAGDYDKAAEASRRAIELGANDAASWSELGEAVVMASGGAVAPEALVAFTNAISLDQHDNRARFYLGLAESQIGNFKQAVAIWRDLEEGSDPNATWLPMVQGHIKAFAKQGGFDPQSVRPSPPSVAALRAAIGAMTGAIHNMTAAAKPSTMASSSVPAAQDTMIRSMVARLDAEMHRKPNDVAGWVRLAHAYNVLGQSDQARTAIEHALRLEPSNVNVLLTLAEAQRASAPPGDDTPLNFVVTMRRVLTLDPTNPSALYYVGLAESKSGHEGVAHAMWSKALAKVAEDDPLAVSLRNALHSAAKNPAKGIN